jgi:hypothetical protein
MTLREDVQQKLMRCEPTYQTALRALMGKDLARAIAIAEGFKHETLALLGSIIDEKRAELSRTLNPDRIRRMEPADFLVTTVTVSKEYLSPFQTAMRRPPNNAECQRILEPMACAQQLLQAALRYIPEDPPDPLMDSTNVFEVR